MLANVAWVFELASWSCAFDVAVVNAYFQPFMI